MHCIFVLLLLARVDSSRPSLSGKRADDFLITDVWNAATHDEGFGEHASSRLMVAMDHRRLVTLSRANATKHNKHKETHSADEKLLPMALPFALYQLYLTGSVLYYAGTGISKTTERVQNQSAMKELAERVVGDTHELFNRLSGGSLNSAVLVRSEYLQLQAMRSDLQTIKKFCHRDGSALQWLVQASLPTVEVAEQIDAKIAQLEGVLSTAADTIFCSQFSDWLEGHLSTATNIIVDWQTASGRTFFPKRSVPNRFFSGCNIRDDCISNQTTVREQFKKEYGLSDAQVDATANRGTVYTARSPHGASTWIHEHTTFPDTFLADAEVEESKKVSYKKSIQEMRLIFAEMDGLSPGCRDRAFETRETTPFCKHCSWCCRMPSQEPSLTKFILKKLTGVTKKLGERLPWFKRAIEHEQAQAWMVNSMDASSAAFAVVGSVTSIMTMATRLSTTVFKRKTCEEVNSLLSKQEVPDPKVLEEKDKWLKEHAVAQEEEDKTSIDTALPEPGDTDCDPSADC